MAYLRVKLPAFTLVETIVAFVLILIITSITSLIFLNVNSSSRFWTKMRVQQEMENIINSTKSESRFIDESFEMEGFRIEKSVHRSEMNDLLIGIELQAFDENQRQIGTCSEIIIE